MPSMLVYLAADRIATLRDRAGGDGRWSIRRGELLDRSLLGPDWTLYVATLRDGRARVIAYLERVAAGGELLGEATPCDVDITPILERLGCAGGADGLPEWARVPRVLPPEDIDRLRYHLGLPLDVAPPPPAPAPPPPLPAPTLGLARDPAVLRLLDAVMDELAVDGPRMVLADRLLELGEPRGELIALQLARARTGDPATPREREILAQHGAAFTQPVTAHLTAYAFRRGFLATAVLDDRAMLRPALCEHPIWSTVEELETGNPTLLLSPALRSLRRVAIPGALLGLLALSPHPLLIEAIVGSTVRAGGRFVQGGVAIAAHDVEPFGAAASLPRLHSMSLSIEAAHAAHAAALLETRLGRRLPHIELFHPEIGAVDPAPWRRVFERARPRSLGLRGVVDGWLVVVVRQAASITVQLGDPVSARRPSLEPLLPLIASLGRGLDEIGVERVGGELAAIDLQSVAAELRAVFRGVTLAPAARWRSP